MGNNVETKLIGTWKVEKSGSDLNGDNKIDSNEVSPIDPNLEIRYLFNKDKTGNISIKGVGGADFNWSLINNDQDIVLTNIISQSKLIGLFKIMSDDSTTYHIEDIQAKALNISFIEDQQLQEYYMSK